MTAASMREDPSVVTASSQGVPDAVVIEIIGTRRPTYGHQDVVPELVRDAAHRLDALLGD